ncbi:hypothetical protein T459_08782 [Capsicum annuum]|uniref:Uncharacterized protein n=1 Tax=Capsicum annuum TaxID=4072 RepID=A0A2G2ZXI3_CAPAN|nr:hypothetical protein T459_08782 [Capsicum annuum]
MDSPLASEQNTYANAGSTYKCLKDTYGVKKEDIALYEKFVGSGPTLHMASRLSRLRVVVLHSPMLSGVCVLHPVKRSYWFDIYKVAFPWFTPSMRSPGTSNQIGASHHVISDL